MNTAPSDASPRYWELEFEMAIAGYLTDDCGLRVHVEGDALNRRRSGYATLRFQYVYPQGADGPAQVSISVPELPACAESFSLPLQDFADQADVAELCSPLAEQLVGRFGSSALPSEGAGRREDD